MCSTSAFSRSCGQLAQKVREWAAAVYAACVDGPRINQPSVPGKRCIARGRLCEWQNCSIFMDSTGSRPAIAGLDPRLSGSESVGVDHRSFSTSSRITGLCPGDPTLLRHSAFAPRMARPCPLVDIRHRPDGLGVANRLGCRDGSSLDKAIDQPVEGGYRVSLTGLHCESQTGKRSLCGRRARPSWSSLAVRS